MYPILVSIGPVSIYTAHVFAVIAWLIFSFLFWRILRSHGVLEERIFDLSFYATLIGVVTARLGFVLLYPALFTGSLLLLGAFWVQPGLWLYGGLLGVLLTFYFLSKRYGVRFAFIFDAFAYALPWTMIPLSLGMLFQGTDPGKVTDFAWAVTISGLDGRRHPVQIYETVALFLLGIISVFLHKLSVDKKWPAAFFGSLLLTIITPVLFGLEFLKDGSVYLYGITVNQWILILVFAESVGSLIIKARRMMPPKKKKGETYDESTAQSNTTGPIQEPAASGTENSGDTNSGTELPGPVSGS